MRNRALLTASLALVAFAGVPAAASATTIKNTTGATVASNSAFSGSLKGGTSAVFNGGAAGSITCTSSTLSGTLGSNPATPSVGASLSSLTFGGCTDTISFVTVSTVTANVGTGANAKTATATYVGAASTFAVSGLVWAVTFTDGKTCVYPPTTNPATAQHDSHTSPSNGEYAFRNVPLTKSASSTSFACPSLNVTFSATYVIGSGGAGNTIQP